MKLIIKGFHKGASEMNILVRIFLTVLLGPSISLANNPSRKVIFNFERPDTQNNCELVRTNLQSRIEAFEKREALPLGSFSYAINKASERKGHHICFAELISNRSEFGFIVDDTTERYGVNRNVGCVNDGEAALNNTDTFGIRTYWDQGWIFYPFCQSFVLRIEKVQ